MPLILRAIITGFGYKIGTELARYLIDRFNGDKKKDAKPSDDLPEGLPTDPGNPGGVEPPRAQPTN